MNVKQKMLPIKSKTRHKEDKYVKKVTKEQAKKKNKVQQIKDFAMVVKV